MVVASFIFIREDLAIKAEILVLHGGLKLAKAEGLFNLLLEEGYIVVLSDK